MSAPAMRPETALQRNASRTVHVARQPIYRRDMSVYAYELLFRTPQGTCVIESGDDATQEVMLNALIDIGLDRLVGNHRAFINLTEAYLTGARPLLHVGERVVLEVLETVEPSAEVLAGLEALANQGHVIALDDYVDRPECEPMLRLAHIVKLDLMAMDLDELEAQVSRLRKFDVQLLAEKVETHEEYRLCMELGFDFFQGYFFCKPDLVSGQRADGNKLIATELMSALQKPGVDFDELQSLLSRDATLAYRLLAYVNSAYFNFRSQITSIRHALTIVGTKGVRQWATLILMSSLSQSKANELLRVGMIRAKMCEALAERQPGVSPDALFTCGLFSILDALMDRPMGDVVASLSVDESVASALLGGGGPLGNTLRTVLAYEQGQTDSLPDGWAAACQSAYLDAVEWSHELELVTGRGGR